MEESSLQPWHLFTFYFLAFQAVVLYLRHLLLTTIAAVAFGAVTEVTSRYCLLICQRQQLLSCAPSKSCSAGGSGSPTQLSSCTALGCFQCNPDIKLQRKLQCVGKELPQNLQLVFFNFRGSCLFGQCQSAKPVWNSFDSLTCMIQVSLRLGSIRWKDQLDHHRGTEVS